MGVRKLNIERATTKGDRPVKPLSREHKNAVLDSLVATPEELKALQDEQQLEQVRPGRRWPRLMN